MNRTPLNAPSGFDWVARLKSWRVEGSKIHAVATTHGGAETFMTFEALSVSIWRFTFQPLQPGPMPPTPMVIGGPATQVPLYAKEEEGGVTVRGTALMLRIESDPWCVKFLDESGEEICRENPYDVDGLGRPFILPLGFVAAGGKVSQVTETLHLRPDEHLFGLGEKFTALDKSGQRIVSWTVDAFGSTTERSHKNIPFLWSTKGFGLLIDSGARIAWEIGTVSSQSCALLIDAPAFAAYVFRGRTPAELLATYCELTGRSNVPPPWSFGLWVSSGGRYRDRRSVEKLVAGLEEHEIPADVVHVDPWWMSTRKYCDFRWNEEAFPDPQGFVDTLHSRELRLCLWEHPYVSIESDLFLVGKKNGYFVRRPDGEVYVIDYGLSLSPRPDGAVREAGGGDSWNAPVAIIDLTNPAARAWFQDLHRPLLRMGVDLFKTDFGEDIPEDGLFHNGETGSTMHNLYPLLYNEAVSEVTRQERGYALVWSRSGTAGSQRFPTCWSGDPASDFDSLASTIRGGLSLGMSGVPFWSNDIGGYRGMPDEELYVRWAQFGLLCSHSRMHGDSPREPWKFGDRALRIVRKFISLRYQLFPYLYSLAHEASRTGMPVLRALPLAFPGDPNTIDKDHEFMLGPWFLVAPVFDRSGERDIYFPAGTWIDFWSGESVAGPRTWRVSAPLDRMPLYVRAGAIIPMAKRILRIPEGPVEPLGLEVYPAGLTGYLLEEGDGKVDIRCEETRGEVALQWTGTLARTVHVAVHTFRIPSSSEINLDGRVISVETLPWEGTRTRMSVQLPKSASGSMRIRF